MKNHKIRQAGRYALSMTVVNLVLMLVSSGRVQAQNDEDSRIYAIFLCQHATNTCTKQGYYSSLIFNTLAECYSYATFITHQSPTADGHFLMSEDLWFECRSKRVDTWQPTQ